MTSGGVNRIVEPTVDRWVRFYIKITHIQCVILLNCKFCAAFGSAPFQDSTTALGGDASAKPVSTGTVACVWLVCSLWHICTILLKIAVFIKVEFEFLRLRLYYI